MPLPFARRDGAHEKRFPRRGIANIKTCLMDGQALEFGDNTFDFAYSIFGLMFFPDRLKGFREMHRTLRPGGRAAVTSWAPVEESPLMQLKGPGTNIRARPL
jgi:ubiquinone/menaquinone biosynthesis C-methylase UbiE